MSDSGGINFFWFRRDLRLNDNAGLYKALTAGKKVLAVFIFDNNILDKLEDKNDRRLVFIQRQLNKINDNLKKHGSTLLIRHGKPADIWKKLIREFNVSSVYTNHDYEPYARKRDEEIRKLLSDKNIQFHTFKDQVIFEKSEIVKDGGSPYLVFTPYKNKWRDVVTADHLKAFPSERQLRHFKKIKSEPIPSLSTVGFNEMKIEFPSNVISTSRIKNYRKTRDFPGSDGTSKLSVHLRFGTISIRKLVRTAWKLSDTFINELIWREFYMMILWHFPDVVDKSFKSEYDFLAWKNNEEDFRSWCEGKTGFPMVDAGMRELNDTGFMHNRVRMITANFLTKYLLIDWRWGEAYFASQLLDYELANNNGGWQWSAGTGVDAAPYFRIFNMDLQEKKFDPDGKYIKKWVPEIDTPEYPEPMVDYEFARKRCLDFFKKGLKE